MARSFLTLGDAPRVRKSANSTYIWYGDVFINHLYQETVGALDEASKYLKSSIQKSLKRHYVYGGKSHKKGAPIMVGGVQVGKYGIKGRSKPGEIPWYETGELYKSIKSKLYVRKGRDPAAITYTENYYSRFLEFGTRRIRPRPFFRPAVTRESAAIRKIFQDIFKRTPTAMKRGNVNMGALF